MTPNKITQPKSTFTHAATHKVITRNSSNPIPAPATKIQTHIRGNTLPCLTLSLNHLKIVD
jgi:hypothetical protein